MASDFDDLSSVLDEALSKIQEANDDLDEIKTVIRQEVIDEITDELESAIKYAESPDAPAHGDAETWGRDDLTGLRAFLVYLTDGVGIAA